MSFSRRTRFGSVYLGLAAILVSVLLPIGVVHAQSTGPARPPLNLTTSPLPLNVVTKPGVPVTADIRIKNNGTQNEQLKIDLMKFGANGVNGQPQPEPRGPRDLYFNWVHFSETNFTAQPNVWKTIHMTISPPKEAAYGYYYAVVFSRANPTRATGGQSAVEGGVASLVLLNVDAPGTRREANIAQLTASQKIYEFLPASFTIKIHNAGNVHVSPAGTMFIKRGDTQVAALDFNTERGNILPGTDRVFTMDWNDGFPYYSTKTTDGKTVKTKLNWNFDKLQKFRFGRYTATIVAVYDDGQRDIPIEATVSFWVIPWRILGVVLLIILMILAGIWGIGRLFWRGIRRQAAAVPMTAQEPAPNSLAAAPRRGRPKKAEPEAAALPPSKRRAAATAPESEPQTAPKKSLFGRFGRKSQQPETGEQPVDKPRRGRPPKAQATAPEPEVRRRGRPPKAQAAAPVQPAVPRRGRPPKNPIVPPVEVAPAAEVRRRGRPPKNPVEVQAPPDKPRRGRPPKNPAATQSTAQNTAQPAKRSVGRPKGSTKDKA